MTPLVSVIIPTANRPQWLARAVHSALSGMPLGDAEVIVVPNGPDESWKGAIGEFAGNRSIRCFPSIEANANQARNHGLAKARGKYVRFLDDDDYLIPDGALKQCEAIEISAADVVSGAIELKNTNGQTFDTWTQPHHDDLCVAMLGPWRCSAISSHLFRRTALEKLTWRPEITVRQDVDWMLSVCCSREQSWAKIEDVVAVWQHHWGVRISTEQKFNDIRKSTVPMLLRAVDSLAAGERLSPARRAAVAAGLWGCVHSAFFLEPKYWSTVGDLARELAPETRPQQKIFAWPVLRVLDPIAIEWLLLPKRWLGWRAKRVLMKWKLAHHW